MDTQRLILLIIFSFSVLMLWEAWQKEHRPPPAATAQGPNTTAPGAAVPGPAAAKADAVPAGAGSATGGASAGASGTVPTNPTAAAGVRQRITVTTDVMVAEIDPLGGDLIRLELLKHRDPDDTKKNLLILEPEHRYALQSGFTSAGLPTHNTTYSAEQGAYTLAAGQSELAVRLNAETANGTKVTKTYKFLRGAYLLNLEYAITNAGSDPIETTAYFHFTRDNRAPPGEQPVMSTFSGPAVYTEAAKYVNFSWSDVDKSKPKYPTTAQTDGWVGIVQHYYVAALLPAGQVKREFYTEKLSEGFYRAGFKMPVALIAAGASSALNLPIYIGPQEQETLKALAPGLDLVVDYGWFKLFAEPLFWLLKFFHGLTSNWGWAIVLLTLVVKLAFYPLQAASYRAMAKMKEVTPRLTKLREQFGDDRLKLNQAMMELYKKEKINPAAGCLPVLVQIPVFIALYWTLLGAVELRQAPWLGWIHDLSLPDPWYILPALMLVSMVIQTKMNPTPPDPVQAKVMKIMPLVFGIMFFWFPSGLVLYWFVNNLFSILQQWYITKKFAKPAVAVKS